MPVPSPAYASPLSAQSTAEGDIEGANSEIATHFEERQNAPGSEVGGHAEDSGHAQQVVTTYIRVCHKTGDITASQDTTLPASPAPRLPDAKAKDADTSAAAASAVAAKPAAAAAPTPQTEAQPAGSAGQVATTPAEIPISKATRLFQKSKKGVCLMCHKHSSPPATELKWGSKVLMLQCGPSLVLAGNARSHTHAVRDTAPLQP